MASSDAGLCGKEPENEDDDDDDALTMLVKRVTKIGNGKGTKSKKVEGAK